MNRKPSTTAPAVNPYIYAIRLRGVLIMSICLILLGIGSIRLGIVQAKYPERFESLDCFQPARTGIIPASRGRIFDTQLRPLADNWTVSSLFVNPSLVPDDLRETLIHAVRLYLDCDPGQVRSAIYDTEATRRILIPEMTQDDIQRFNSIPYSVETAELFREVGIWNHEARVYPYGPLAGPVIGFTSARDEGQVGLWGLEGRYDDILSGRPGKYNDLRDQHGNRIPGSREEILSPRNGTDIVLTLDADIQALGEAALIEGLENTGALNGTVVITEPRTGDVLALVSHPALDPSNYAYYVEDEEALFSRSTCLSYEAGSVMKVFTFAAALEENIIQPDSEFRVTMGPLWFGGKRVRDHAYDHPVIDLRHALVHSSNRAAGLVAQDLGRDRLVPWLQVFGFGEKTSLDMPGEPSGNLKESLDHMPLIDLVNAGFGQGITVTPLQIIQAMSVFANDGVLVPLRLVKSRFDPSWGQLVEISRTPGWRVLNPSTAQLMEEFMVGVIDEGTAMQARTEWVCAGKTATAQKVNPDGGYFEDRFYSTFVGYGPLPGPKWTILVILDEPGIPYYGGAACGPVFKDIFNALMLRDGERHTVHDETQLIGTIAQTEYVISRDPFSGSEAN